jgi:hypothetical protein
MGAAGRARVEQNFTDAIICEKTFAVYNRVVEARKTP